MRRFSAVTEPWILAIVSAQKQKYSFFVTVLEDVTNKVLKVHCITYNHARCKNILGTL